MTDSIDLDDIDVEENDGDWLWRSEEESPSAPMSLRDDPSEEPPAADSAGAPGNLPGVPSESTGDEPARGGSERGQEQDAAGTREATAGAGTAESHGATEPDEMTMAMTFKAIHHFAEPQLVFSEARGWADWLGIVGEVSTPAIRKLMRDELLDVDFFGGSDGGPAERLAEIDETSMFFAERMVLVGVPGDEWIAEEAGWEFVPLTEAAEKADWTLERDPV